VRLRFDGGGGGVTDGADFLGGGVGVVADVSPPAATAYDLLLVVGVRGVVEVLPNEGGVYTFRISG